MNVKRVLDSLNLDQIRTDLAIHYHRAGPGRNPLNPLSMLKAQLAKHLLTIISDRRLSLRLQSDHKVARACGFRRHTPSHGLFTHFRHRLGEETYQRVFNTLTKTLIESGALIGKVLAVDSTHLKTYSGRAMDNRAGGSDPDARVGRGRRGFSLGYLSLFLVDIEGFPLGHVEAPLNVNEKQLVEALLHRVLGECIEVELLAGDSQLESEAIFMLLESLKVSHIIAWRKLKGRRNPPEVLSVKDRIDVEGPEWMRAIYKRLRAAAESFNGRAKSRLAYQRLTWQGLGNACIHVGLVLMMAYAVCIAAYGIGRPELRQSVAFFA